MANLKKSSTVNGKLIWSGSNLKLTPSGDSILFNSHKLFSEYDKPDAANGDMLNVVNKTGDTITGIITFATYPITPSLRLIKSALSDTDVKGKVDIIQDSTGSLQFVTGRRDGVTTGENKITIPDVTGTVYTTGNKPLLTDLGFGDYWITDTTTIRPNNKDIKVASSATGIIPFSTGTGYIGTTTNKFATGFINTLTSDMINTANTMYTGNGIIYYGNTTTGGVLRFTDTGTYVLKPMNLSGTTGAINIGPNSTNAIKMGVYSSGDNTQTMLVGDNSANALPLQLVGRNTKKLTYKTLNASSAEVVYPIYHEGNKPTPAELGMYTNSEIDTKIDSGGKVGSVDGILPDATKNVVLNAARTIGDSNFFTNMNFFDGAVQFRGNTLIRLPKVYNYGSSGALQGAMLGFESNGTDTNGNGIAHLVVSKDNILSFKNVTGFDSNGYIIGEQFTYNKNGLLESKDLNATNTVLEKGVRVYSPNNKPTLTDLNFDVYTKPQSDARYLQLSGGVLTGSLQINNENLILKSNNEKNIYLQNDSGNQVIFSLPVEPASKINIFTLRVKNSASYNDFSFNGNGQFGAQTIAAYGNINTVTGNITISNGKLLIPNNNIEGYAINLTNRLWLNGTSSFITFNGTNTQTIKFDNGIKITPATGKDFLFDTNGTLTVPTNISALDFIVRSDKRDKINPVKIDNGLDVIRSLNGYKYGLKTPDGVVDSAGIIAQELQKVAPELVTNDINFEGKPRLRIKPVGVIGYMVDAINTLSDKIDQLNQEIFNLKNGK